MLISLRCVHWEIRGGHRVLPPLTELSWTLGPYPTTPDRDPEACQMALAMGKWGCWLAVAVHVVVRGKEAMCSIAVRMLDTQGYKVLVPTSRCY